MRANIEYLNSRSKRRLDVLGGTAIATLLMPVGALAGLASSIDTRTLNPIFKQARLGSADKHIEIYKFRTLPKSLESESVETYGTFDPRASKMGMAMRESGIDEMPQLVNVIRGEMSLVGMRPMLEADIDRFKDISPALYRQWYEVYSRTKPGLAGPSQVLRHQYKVTTDDLYKHSMELDLEYTRTASLRKDLKIIASTPFKMLMARINMVDNSPSEDAETRLEQV